MKYTFKSDNPAFAHLNGKRCSPYYKPMREGEAGVAVIFEDSLGPFFARTEELVPILWVGWPTEAGYWWMLRRSAPLRYAVPVRARLSMQQIVICIPSWLSDGAATRSLCLAEVDRPEVWEFSRIPEPMDRAAVSAALVAAGPTAGDAGLIAGHEREAEGVPAIDRLAMPLTGSPCP